MKDILEELEKNISLASAANKRTQGDRLKNILNKAQNRRTPEEIDELVAIITEIKFFQERKEIKPSDFRDLVTAFQYTEVAEKN